MMQARSKRSNVGYGKRSVGPATAQHRRLSSLQPYVANHEPHGVQDEEVLREIIGEILSATGRSHSSRSRNSWRESRRAHQSDRGNGSELQHCAAQDQHGSTFQSSKSNTKDFYVDRNDAEEQDLHGALDYAAKNFIDSLQQDGIPADLHGVDPETAQALLARFGASIIGTQGGGTPATRDLDNEYHSVTDRHMSPDLPGFNDFCGVVDQHTPSTQHMRRGSARAGSGWQPSLSKGQSSGQYPSSGSQAFNVSPAASSSQLNGDNGIKSHRLDNDPKDGHWQSSKRTAKAHPPRHVIKQPVLRPGGFSRLSKHKATSKLPDPRLQSSVTDGTTLGNHDAAHETPQSDSMNHGEVKARGVSARKLEDEMKALRLENEELRAINSHLHANSASVIPPTKWRVLHRVHCPDLRGLATFTDEPQLVENPSDSRNDHRWHWEGWNRVAKLRLSAIEAASGPFVVYRDYDCSRAHNAEEELSDDEDSNDDRDPDHSFVQDPPNRHIEQLSNGEHQGHGKGHSNHGVKESVKIVSRSLRRIITHMWANIPGLQAYEPYYNQQTDTLNEPYYFFYHFEAEIIAHVNQSTTITKSELAEMMQLLEYFSIQSSDSAREAKSMFSKGRVQPHLMRYLFKPGSLLLSSQGKQPICMRQSSTLEPADMRSIQKASQWYCTVSSFSFDGQFRSKEGHAYISIAAREVREQLITNLRFYPLEHATPDLRAQLIARGHNFLGYCRKHYVTHSAEAESVPRGPGLSLYAKDDDLSDKHQTQVRYMVDAEAYRMLHEDEREGPVPNKGEIIQPDLGSEEFLSQLPAFVNGFHMVKKKWEELTVSNVLPVQWNKAAFDNLEVADDTKELIKALITNKIDSNESVDFVEGKGTGLIVLLHGGPGTGKTLTAETVAEIAERPLYRVSCGDIGTEAGHVEDYLTSVFYLGRRWGSVVLLDEADVFLEERSLDNLQRNALVSVFLRMIEYYDGILVLTSNRVGIFDEAFKSRIQLSLYYPNLDLAKRRQIWLNFLRRLETLQEKIDKDDIHKHIEDLAKYEMNGRQIRNAITSARQLSRYKCKPLDFEMLKSVLNVGQRFEEYLREVKGHTADDYARDGGIR